MTVLISGMVESDEIDWVNSRLRKAKLTDVSRDFSDGNKHIYIRFTVQCPRH